MHPRLTEGPVGPTLFRLATPMFWGLLAMVVVMGAETFYIARLGPEPLAALSFTFPVLRIMEFLAIGIGIGASSVVARAIGGGSVERVQQYVLGSLLLALLVVGSIGIGIWLLLDPLFRLLGASPELMPLVRDYMRIALPASVVIALPIVGNSCLRGAGETRFAGYNMAVVSVVSMGLLPLLIFGYGPLPRLGLAGAAWTALLTETLSALISLYALIYREKLLGRCRIRFATLRREWRDILHVGMPATLNNLIPGFSAAFTTSLLAAEGPMAVAGYGVATRIENFALIVFWALSAVIGPMAGQNLGAHQQARVEATCRLSFRFCMAFGLVAAAVFAVFATPLAALFAKTPDVNRVTVLYLWIVPLSYGLWAVVMMANGVLNGVGQPRPALLLTLLRMVIFYVPLALIGAEVAGVAGIFMAALFSNSGAGVLAWRWSSRVAAAAPLTGVPFKGATAAVPASEG